MEGSTTRPDPEWDREISPVKSRPRFIDGLYHDADLRLPAIVKDGGLTFTHSQEGDIELQETSRSSTIPVRHPPMNESTVDWSLVHRADSSGKIDQGEKEHGGTIQPNLTKKR